jgi:DNA-binding MarR family transcriptional regulator
MNDLNDLNDLNERTANLLGALVVALGDALEEATATAAGHGGAGPAALATIAQLPPPSVGTLGERVGLSQSAGVRLVDRLAADGLLTRGAGHDGRTLAVAATPAGTARAAQVLAARRQVLAEALAALTTAKQAQLAQLLAQLLDRLTGSPAEAGRICRLCEVATCPQDRCPVTRAADRVRAADADLAGDRR